MKLPDTFETRIYLMFIHFSILMIITKKKGSKFDQTEYDKFLNKIEYNLKLMGKDFNQDLEIGINFILRYIKKGYYLSMI